MASSTPAPDDKLTNVEEVGSPGVAMDGGDALHKRKQSEESAKKANDPYTVVVNGTKMRWVLLPLDSALMPVLRDPVGAELCDSMTGVLPPTTSSSVVADIMAQTESPAPSGAKSCHGSGAGKRPASGHRSRSPLRKKERPSLTSVKKDKKSRRHSRSPPSDSRNDTSSSSRRYDDRAGEAGHGKKKTDAQPSTVVDLPAKDKKREKDKPKGREKQSEDERKVEIVSALSSPHSTLPHQSTPTSRIQVLDGAELDRQLVQQRPASSGNVESGQQSQNDCYFVDYPDDSYSRDDLDQYAYVKTEANQTTDAMALQQQGRICRVSKPTRYQPLPSFLTLANPQQQAALVLAGHQGSVTLQQPIISSGGGGGGGGGGQQQSMHDLDLATVLEEEERRRRARDQCAVFIRGFPNDFKEIDIMGLHSEARNVRMSAQRDYAFLIFDSPTIANNALEQLRRTFVDHRPLQVSEARSQTDRRPIRPCTLYVGGLDPQTQHHVLQAAFPRAVEIVISPVHPQAYMTTAFVRFAETKYALLAFMSSENKYIGNRRVEVYFARRGLDEPDVDDETAMRVKVENRALYQASRRYPQLLL